MTHDDDDEAILARIRLARAPGLGPRGLAALRGAARERRQPAQRRDDEPPVVTIEQLLALGAGGLCALGLPERVARALFDPGLRELAREELNHLRARRDLPLGLGLPGYPAHLDGIPDTPPFLCARGELRPEDARAVAVVGARRATPAGLLFAHGLARDLALAGLTVVSGLARGVDQAAHEGALAAGGRTLAVLGAGLDCPLPPPAAALAARISAAGAVLSEFAPRERARKHTFPQRNRVIAGLARGVIVVQAGDHSGALITADLAQDSAREVFAVPGWPEEPLARGPNRLLRDGAHLVEHAGDVLDVLVGQRSGEPDPQARSEDDAPPRARPQGEPEARLLRALGPRARDLPELLTEAGLDWRAGLLALGRLELAGHARRAGPGYVRVE